MLNPDFKRLAGCMAVGLLAALATGCQSYSPKPVDLDAYHHDWQARATPDATVREFINDILGENREARTFDIADGLTLAEAEAFALWFNPDVRLARAKAGIALASAENMRGWITEELNLDFEALTILEDVANPLVAGGGISLTIPLSGRPQDERTKAFAEHGAAAAEAARTEQETVASLRRLWRELAAARTRARLMEAFASGVEERGALAAKLAEAGQIRRMDARQFTIEALRARIDAEHAMREAGALELELRAVVGLHPSATVEFHAALDAALPGTAAAAEQPFTRRSPNPALLVRVWEYEVAEAALMVEIDKQYPDITIGPRAESDEGQTKLGLGLGLPIPSFNLNRRGIAEARASREAARVALETEFEKQTALLTAARQKREAHAAQRTRIERELAPLADAQAADAATLQRLGAADVFLQLEALKGQLEVKSAVLDCVLAQSHADDEIARLTGAFMNGPAALAYNRKSARGDKPATDVPEDK